MKGMLTGLLAWTDARFPLSKLWNEHLAKYYAPKNFNFWYFFGSLALLMLVLLHYPVVVQVVLHQLQELNLFYFAM